MLPVCFPLFLTCQYLIPRGRECWLLLVFSIRRLVIRITIPWGSVPTCFICNFCNMRLSLFELDQVSVTAIFDCLVLYYSSLQIGVHVLLHCLVQTFSYRFGIQLARIETLFESSTLSLFYHRLLPFWGGGGLYWLEFMNLPLQMVWIL